MAFSCCCCCFCSFCCGAKRAFKARQVRRQQPRAPAVSPKATRSKRGSRPNVERASSVKEKESLRSTHRNSRSLQQQRSHINDGEKLQRMALKAAVGRRIGRCTNTKRIKPEKQPHICGVATAAAIGTTAASAPLSAQTANLRRSVLRPLSVSRLHLRNTRTCNLGGRAPLRALERRSS